MMVWPFVISTCTCGREGAATRYVAACVTDALVRDSMCGGPGRGDERACASERAASAPNLAVSASVASAVGIAASAFSASDFAALAAPSCSLAGSGSGFTAFDLVASNTAAAAFAAFDALASLAATVTASASRRLSSVSEALALALIFALAAAACVALACSFATAAILATRAAAFGDTVFLAVSANLARDSARDAEFVVLREHLFVLRFESSGGMTSKGGSRVCAPRCRQIAGTQELRHGLIGADGLQAVWRDVPARIAPARRSCEQPLRPERLRAWPARVMGMGESWWVERTYKAPHPGGAQRLYEYSLAG
eukprot:scaffold86713_cov66-Phaeocystis_antarctica.AAC.2